MSDLFSIRPYRAETDAAFVVAAWVSSNRYAPPSLGIRREVYQREERVKVLRLLADSTVFVAHAPGSEDALLGFACLHSRGPCVHYVYVKKDARRLGIAKELVEPGNSHFFFTHLPVVRGLPIPKGWTYNPYLLRSA